MKTYTCEKCDKEFTPEDPRPSRPHRFCSNACKLAPVLGYKTKVYTCQECGGQFTPSFQRDQKHQPKFCSKACVGASKRTDEENMVDRFWSYVEKTDGCWIWKGGKTKGYGAFKIGNKQYKAHRVAYDLTHDEPLGDRLGCHECDNPSCVRPDHIFPGTQLDNAQDKMQKGRFVNVYGQKRVHTGVWRGTDNTPQKGN